jgi:hypothetical protein
MVQPAEGPSLGVAPAGTWTWTAERSRKLLPGSTRWRKLRAKVCAMLALSFITSPSWPARKSPPDIVWITHILLCLRMCLHVLFASNLDKTVDLIELHKPVAGNACLFLPSSTLCGGKLAPQKSSRQPINAPLLMRFASLKVNTVHNEDLQSHI